MKKTFLSCWILFFISCHLHAADIVGPPRVCPGDMVTYEWNDAPNCDAVMWLLKQNGFEVVSHVGTAEWTFQWPMTAVGNATIEVDGFSCCWLCDDADDYNVKVGLADPTASIGGPGTICPSASETYSINAIGGATSYTWEVPSGWTVNGIAGPIVSGQGNSVSLSTGTSGSAGYVKVRGDNAICGSSTYLSTYIQEDYHPIVTVSTQCSSMPEFDAFTQGAVSYDWQVPPGWYIAYGQGTPSMMAYNYNNSGFVVVMTETVCGTVTQGYYYYDASPCGSFLSTVGSDVDVHPNPMDGELLLINRLGVSIGSVTILNENGEVIRQFDTSEKNTTVDVSGLKPGTYYLKYKQGDKIATERLVKN